MAKGTHGGRRGGSTSGVTSGNTGGTTGGGGSGTFTFDETAIPLTGSGQITEQEILQMSLPQYGYLQSITGRQTQSLNEINIAAENFYAETAYNGDTTTRSFKQRQASITRASEAANEIVSEANQSEGVILHARVEYKQLARNQRVASEVTINGSYGGRAVYASYQYKKSTAGLSKSEIKRSLENSLTGWFDRGNQSDYTQTDYYYDAQRS